jgi:hypothetical protein
VFLVALASVAIFARSAGHAAADGDPASDVLLAQSLFLYRSFTTDPCSS